MNCSKEILQSEQVYCSLLRGLNFQRQCISFLINGLNGGSTTARCSELSWQSVTMSHVVTTRHKEAEEDPPPPQDCPQCSNVPMFLQLTDSGGDCGDAGFHCCAELHPSPSCSGCSVLCVLINPNDRSVCTCIALLLTIDTSASYCWFMIIICEAARITNLIIIWDWEATTSCAAQMWLCCRAVAKPSQSFHSARKAPTHLAPV